MSTQRILYEDKETFQESPLDEINKATASNYNEIKSVVNFNANELDASAVRTTGIITVNSAQLLAINTTPKELIAAQGANKMIVVLGFYIKYIHVTTPYTTDPVVKFFMGGVTAAVTTGVTMASSNDEYSRGDGLSSISNNNNDFANQNIILSTSTSDPTAGDGTVEIVIHYTVMDV